MGNVRTFLLSLVLLSLTISLATSPEPPPFYRYNIRGNVLCDSIDDLSDYTVVLYGKNIHFINGYERVDTMYPEQEFPIALTDTSGGFFVVTNFYHYIDSIKVALVSPHSEPLFSEAIWVDTLQLRERWVDRLVPAKSGCSSCSVQPQSDYVTQRKLDRYEFHQSDTEIFICE